MLLCSMLEINDVVLYCIVSLVIRLGQLNNTSGLFVNVDIHKTISGTARDRWRTQE